MRLPLLAPLALLAALLAGCPGPTFVVQQYAGPVRPRESIATLRVNGSDAVRLLTLDDEYVAAPLESDSRLHIELLPGRHSLTIQNAKAPDERQAPIVFEAEAGKVYRVILAAAGPAQLWEVDRSADSAAREVSGSPGAPVREVVPAPAPAPAPVIQGDLVPGATDRR